MKNQDLEVFLNRPDDDAVYDGVGVRPPPGPGGGRHVNSSPASVTVTSTANVGRTFTVRSTSADITGSTPACIPAGQSGTITFAITPTAAAGTAVSGTLSVVSNTSVANQVDTFATLPYSCTAG
ncbi:MAG TPA: hypothetical protein VH478_13885 [Trebonia sp.]|nr:hypothetical protein [Trebonia sp.]